MTLFAKDKIQVEKICLNEKQKYKFERDMPAKYGLLFSKIPYYIKTEYIYE